MANANIPSDKLSAPATVGASASSQVGKNFMVTGVGAHDAFRLDFFVGKVVAASGVSAKMQHSTALNIWEDTKSVSLTASTDTTATASASTDELTATAHGLADNDPFVISSSGVLPGGLAADTLYYAKRVSANVIQARSEADGPALDITDAGSGTHKVTAVRQFSLKFLAQVAGDQTYMPLRSLGRAICTTGAGDSAQFLKLKVSQED